jgi:hypothetical protein
MYQIKLIKIMQKYNKQTKKIRQIISMEAKLKDFKVNQINIQKNKKLQKKSDNCSSNSDHS